MKSPRSKRCEFFHVRPRYWKENKIIGVLEIRGVVNVDEVCWHNFRNLHNGARVYVVILFDIYTVNSAQCFPWHTHDVLVD